MNPVIWFTGLSGAGKSTIARALEIELKSAGIPVRTLDGDEIRAKISKDLGFSPKDRAENLRRISALAHDLNRSGAVVLVATISPYRHLREEIRQRHAYFLEVFVNAPLEVCETRDPKGLYKKARAGLIGEFTGISAPYEAPLAPDVECRTDLETLQISCAKVMTALSECVARATTRDLTRLSAATSAGRATPVDPTEAAVIGTGSQFRAASQAASAPRAACSHREDQ